MLEYPFSFPCFDPIQPQHGVVVLLSISSECIQSVLLTKFCSRLSILIPVPLISFVINSVYKHLVSSDRLMIVAQAFFISLEVCNLIAHLSFLPLTPPFPPPPQILKLSYNKLREISSSLTFSGLTSLLRLYLDHNLLQHIHPRALLQLPSLRLLRLQGNRLHQLHPNTLCTLSLLNTYYFSTLR